MKPASGCRIRPRPRRHHIPHRGKLGRGDEPRILELLGQYPQPVAAGKGGKVGQDVDDPVVLHGMLAKVG
jgi:hypothetical protein